MLDVSSAGARLVAEVLAARALYTALLDHERVESFQGAVRQALATYAGALNADAELRGGDRTEAAQGLSRQHWRAEPPVATRPRH